MRWRRSGKGSIPGARLESLSDETALDPGTGTVASRQIAEVTLPTAEIEPLWKAESLERLARTYWSTLRRFFLGLVYVSYTETGRTVVFVHPRLSLLSFRTPEYEIEGDRGLVRWRIDRGLLVSRRGRDGSGYLQIEVARSDEPESARTRLRVEVEVANYYPALTGVSKRLYAHTQSRIHVLTCNYFLRRLLRRDLDASRTGKLRAPA
ncbi:MAG TPA: hypothetical protein VFI17_07460 [Solirubrobacterales bacterium]|nr:hypothetical protein [Solirubrobacterales bacterium]